MTTHATDKNTRTATTSKPMSMDTVETARVRDCELDASSYDFDTGELLKRLEKASSQMISYSVEQPDDD